MTLAHLTDLLSAVAVGMALVSGAATLASTGQAAISLAVLLDLLMAAGLLHLAADPTIIRAASAAIVLVVRQLVSWSLSERGQGRSGPPSRMARTAARVVRVFTLSPWRRELGD